MSTLSSINGKPLSQIKMSKQFWFLLMTLLRFLNLERTIFHSKENNRQSKFTFTFRSSACRQISLTLCNSGTKLPAATEDVTLQIGWVGRSWRCYSSVLLRNFQIPLSAHLSLQFGLFWKGYDYIMHNYLSFLSRKNQ